MNAKEIAQWVIDNRYPKSESEKVSDHEMYHELVLKIEQCNAVVIDCSTCKHINVSKYCDPCRECNEYSNHQLRPTLQD